MQEDSLLTEPLTPKKSDQGNQEQVQTLVKGNPGQTQEVKTPKKQTDKEQNKTEPGGWMKSHWHMRRKEVHKVPRCEGFMSETKNRGLGKCHPFHMAGNALGAGTDGTEKLG